MKEKIIEFNKQFGIKTEFISDDDIEGYSLGNTIYLNENSNDLEKVNKHELLHFFENDQVFELIKNEMLKANKDIIDNIRSVYYLRYYGLYTEDEIKNGIIDNEIIIDMLIDNFVISYKDGLKLGNYVLKQISSNIENKKYLNLKISNQINNMNLSKWDKLFIFNFYDGKNHIIPQKENRKEKIEEDIKNELNRLYNLTIHDFEISKDSKEILRRYESEIKALEAKGSDTSYLKRNKNTFLEELAKKFTKDLYNQYRQIVNNLKKENYEDSFKVLMLRETLSKTYKLDNSSGKKTLIDKRKLNESISSHLILNKTVLDIIYNHVDEYDKFANIYFAALEVFNKTTVLNASVSLQGLDTFNMGHWIKFEGKKSNEEEYLKNVEELASLVKDTPWCTKDLASTHLAEGDFYVFVDNNNKPHIAVKMNGSEIDEVRGIQNGCSQEIESDYRDIAISFLRNNKLIKNGDKWLRKEEWNKRLINYINDIEDGCFKQEDTEKLLNDLFGDYEYKPHADRNINRSKLNLYLPDISKNLAEYFNCSEDEISFDNINFSDSKYKDLKVCPYKVIFGDANFRNSSIEDLGNLKLIMGDATFKRSNVKSLGSLERIVGNVWFNGCNFIDLGNLENIGGFSHFENSSIKSLGKLSSINGDVYFDGANIKDLGSLKHIGGDVVFTDSKIENLSQLSSIGGDAYFENSNVVDLGNLRTIGSDAYFSGSKIESLFNLESIGGRVDFSYSNIRDLGTLKLIGENVNFENSKITSLGNVEVIKGNANFTDSNVEDLGSLKRIDGSAYFENSKIKSLGNLETVGESLYLNGSSVCDIGKLKEIKKDANFEGCKIDNLNNLETIGGHFNLSNSTIKDLGNLSLVGGDVILNNTDIKTLSKLKMIKGSFNAENTNLESLGSLESIGAIANFMNSSITDLGLLTSIGGDAFFSNSKIENLGNLVSIGGNLYLTDSKIGSLCNLQYVAGDIILSKNTDNKIKDLGTLQSVGGSVDFQGFDIKSLGCLKSIGRNAYFENSSIEDLGDLSFVGGDANFSSSNIENLANLQYVGGNLIINNSKIKNFSNLNDVRGYIYLDNDKVYKWKDFIESQISNNYYM